MPSSVLSSNVSAAPASDCHAGPRRAVKKARPDGRRRQVSLFHQSAQQCLGRTWGPAMCLTGFFVNLPRGAALQAPDDLHHLPFGNRQ